jgi:hypothetical protein
LQCLKRDGNDDEWSVACGCRLDLVEVHHSSGLHVAATVWYGVSAMSGGIQVGGVQAADVSLSSSSFVGVVGGVVIGASGKGQASVLMLELLVVVHHRPSSSVESGCRRLAMEFEWWTTAEAKSSIGRPSSFFRQVEH